ncbi:sugar transferase [Microvirga brassicacearum]|uniref:Sugar transferase n=1 Tax=Microvirga brassicacearum TaxID=2580413 RepID=A0A5N3PDA9_9HYPH|nr:sugar transferase [Microvirga brassicacearum]KAB0267737.1 sugar transferase [Microvirga brassicacearum]
MSKQLLSDRSLSPIVHPLPPIARLHVSLASILFIAGQATKRVVDVIGASFLLILGIPVFLAVAALVAIDGGPVFFRHRRVGKKGRTFGCIKFRTMILGAEECLGEYLSYHPEAQMEWAKEQKLSFDPRVTAIGRFLRLSSLDELPQLINVIKGDMSLVGPRPVTQGELAHYGFATSIYKSVRPGITGLWQVSGRNDVGYDTRVRLDEQYVKNWNLAADLQILLRTPAVVISRRGAR